MAHKEMILLEEDVFVIPLNIFIGGCDSVVQTLGEGQTEGFSNAEIKCIESFWGCDHFLRLILKLCGTR